MKANKTHISLETAELLKDCEVENKYYWYADASVWNTEWKVKLGEYRTKPHNYPAYTWQEILLESKTFFGEEFIAHRNWYNQLEYREYIIHSEKLLRLLQQKKYDEADKYFRDNCKLIKR